jgi:RNA polymerase sigma-70 factor (ECF subfamily)
LRLLAVKPAGSPAPLDASGQRVIAFVGDQAAWVRALTQRQPAATAAFYDCYAPRVLRILARLLGHNQDLADVHHDTFVGALESIATLKDPSRLTAWVTSVAVLTAKAYLQKRARRRWLVLAPPETLAESTPSVAASDPAEQEALRAAYRVLDHMPTEERLVFALRFIEGMRLAEVAEACGVSLATAKRRLARAEPRFVAAAEHEPSLLPWLARGVRCTRT